MERKQVVFLLPYEANFHSAYGGAVVQWVGEIVKRSQRHDYAVIATQRGDGSTFVRPVCARLAKVLFSNHARKGLGAFLWCYLNGRHWQKADIIVVENRLEYASILRRLGYKGRIIVHMHNDVFGALNDEYLHKVNTSVDNLMCCSYSVAKPLETRHPELFTKFRVVHNGVDSDRFQRNDKAGIDRPKILFVGRLEENKGTLLLVEAYKEIVKVLPHAELHIAGDGGREPDQTYIAAVKAAAKKCEQLGGKVIFHGFVNHDTALPSLYAHASVLCFCSIHTEALPVVIIEAMFSGLPIVASAVGGVEEALGDAGLLYPPGNAKALKEKLLLALTDESLRVSLANSAHERAVNRFSWPVIQEQFESVLDHAN